MTRFATIGDVLSAVLPVDDSAAARAPFRACGDDLAASGLRGPAAEETAGA